MILEESIGGVTFTFVWGLLTIHIPGRLNVTHSNRYFLSIQNLKFNPHATDFEVIVSRMVGLDFEGYL